MESGTHSTNSTPTPAGIVTPPPHPSVFVREAKLKDAAEIARIGREGFALAHRDAFRPEDLAYILDNTFSPENVYQEIIDNQTRLFVAEIGKQIVGIVRLRPGISPINLPASRPVELTWMYLAPDSIGTGVGSALMRRAIDQACSEGVDNLWLTVWTSNRLAIPFYKRWGFRVAGMHTVSVGHSHPIAYIMSQKFNQASLLH